VEIKQFRAALANKTIFFSALLIFDWKQRQCSPKRNHSAMSHLNLFQKTAIATVIATIFLIFIGGVVRATGAGLGCPDWPKCWGKWWPPSSVEEIPTAATPDPEKGAFYQGHRTDTLEDGTKVHRQHFVTEFNKSKMWTEYINRLIGVVIGMFIVATFVLSFRYRKSKPAIFWGSLGALILVLFQGWLGGMVVRSGLKPGMITLHMVVAIILMCLLLWVTFLAMQNKLSPPPEDRKLRRIAILLFAITVLQIIFGSQVREALQAFEHDPTTTLARAKWIDQVGLIDHIHRAFSWTVLLCGGFLFWKLFVKSTIASSALKKTSGIIFLLIVLQIIYGITLAYFGLPPVFQILHLGFASVLICAEFLLILMSRTQRHA
jgi:cytochrome c oxidase assembly protein subunit 15